MNILVLGSGLVGGPMAIDLSKNKKFKVTVADIDATTFKKLEKNYQVRGIQKDLSSADEVKKLVAGYDMVVSAVPGFMGFRTLQAIIEAGKNVVDIAFFIEDPFALDKLAKKDECNCHHGLRCCSRDVQHPDRVC